jgi:hypothetical protein
MGVLKFANYGLRVRLTMMIAPAEFSLLDTFPDFLKYWNKVQDQPASAQLQAWADEYMALTPELRDLQIADMTEQGMDWRQVAGEHVFPFLRKRLEAMREAHANLKAQSPGIVKRAWQSLAFHGSVQFVIYVGIGCGAGWAAIYQGKPSVLFGLENIAECGWSGVGAIKGLVAHELGHLIQRQLRTGYGLASETGPWWQLYEEGFAQRCETLILGADSWHQNREESGWLEWCQDHQAWLAAEFLRTVDAGKPVSAFFGSWFELAGRSETGYYLGHELIKELEKRFAWLEVACLESLGDHARTIIERFASSAAE